MRFAHRVVLLTCALASQACVNTHVSPGGDLAPNDAIVVVGEGEAQGKPDVVNLQVGVEARANDPKVAIDAANTKMTRLIEVLKQAGVKAEDMQTRDFNINSEYVEPGYEEPLDASVSSEAAAMPAEVAPRPLAEPKSAPAMKTAPPSMPVPPPPPVEPKRRLVYRVSNMLQVTLRDLTKVGEVLGQAVAAGANQAWGISFGIDDDAPLMTQARADAIADARKQADELAKLAGVRLGRVLSVVDEGSGGGPMPVPMLGRAKFEAASVPVEAGQLAVQRRVRVVFAIETDAKE